ncbi:conserved protein of unknown function [Pseudomonas sp. JV551A1]|uniref:Uncharacterized protein n=2 Tax=Pseudomonas TaxID=286 RepID=A0AAQ1STL9_9PSED|nr:conserved protein of unknown function [Pseudomonas sp. JV551A1]SPO60399.1 conserved protein of unknown function [Pseudomonas inefficax]
MGRSFKEELEVLAGISKWNPTEHDLDCIARDMVLFRQKSPRLSKMEAARLILRHTRAEFKPQGGLDNKDLSTLLAMAMLRATR